MRTQGNTTDDKMIHAASFLALNLYSTMIMIYGNGRIKDHELPQSSARPSHRVQLLPLQSVDSSPSLDEIKTTGNIITDKARALLLYFRINMSRLMFLIQYIRLVTIKLYFL